MQNLRSYRILDYMRQKKYCSLRELMERFQVSTATIHRDVAELAQTGALRRVRGAVAYPENVPQEKNAHTALLSFRERMNWNRSKKLTIARRALERVCEGDILFLDSSTTVSYLADLLADSNFSNLTIVTNAVSVIQNFHRFPPHYVRISLGGSYDLQLHAFLGQAAIRELEHLSISKAFVSAFGLCDDSITTNHENHAVLLRHVLDMAAEKYLLLDRSKYKRSGLFKIGQRRMFDGVISD